MSTRSSRPHQLSHDARATNPQSVGTLGREAAIRWKSLKKKWFSTLVVAIGSISLLTLTLKPTSLNEQNVLLDQRIRELQELGSKTAEKIESLVDLSQDVVKRSEFEEALVQVEIRMKMISPQENSSHLSPADKEGKPWIVNSKQDFASFSAGASIVEHLTSTTWSSYRQIHPPDFPFYKKKHIVSGSPPLTALASDLSIWTCWPFHGTTGQIAISLARTIWVGGLTIGHVHRSLAYDIRTAPKEFELWGLHHDSQEAEGDLLLKGTYDIDDSHNIQEFLVPKRNLHLYPRVLLKIKSNHGNPNLTCLYRVQVHGEYDDKLQGNGLNYATPT
ncbi:hypothetical protein MJO28_006627 [Puccinia striiformis f. sp. tritici]|uniref:SUN domain-containing protein n=2 Tax=Puccinia striiformis TaxID=27350 RepID=A0A2S4V6W6_9BASI|nr:hypothetical protein MJO28_006627 [Puccinia striiformis f. sp. tritici]POW05282.1 hypothetical protein PSHT_10875 [Puccinia striiformis]